VNIVYEHYEVLSVTLFAAMLSVIMLGVVILNVVVPHEAPDIDHKKSKLP
jgi:hypothetical protein